MTDLDALWAFLVAGLVALVLSPLAARLAHRVGAIDRPSERSLHSSPTPSLGGLAILAGVLLAGWTTPATAGFPRSSSSPASVPPR
jgi:UDP-GlcNAc:undecaprenyl-phosphate GlcNAc-1-phosphate transferase